MGCIMGMARSFASASALALALALSRSTTPTFTFTMATGRFAALLLDSQRFVQSTLGCFCFSFSFFCGNKLIV